MNRNTNESNVLTNMKSIILKESNLFENEEGRAIPLITFNTSTKQFSINENAESFLKKITGPIGVVAVAGMYRTGKSYLLNRMLLNRSNGFSVGPSINPCTKGLWIWSKPINGHSFDGTPLNVLIIDTEGIGATDEDQNHDSKIFTLGLLLSSYFIFNSQNSIDENSIQNLSFIVNITKNIQINNHKEDLDPKDYANFLPSFMWVLRDFSLQLKNSEGEQISSKEYLEKCLEVQKGFSDSIEQKNKIRNLLKDFFKERDCTTLVRPLTDEENLQNLSNLELSSLRPEFAEQVLGIRKKILHKIKPKVLKGQILNGEMFCSMIDSYVNSINKGAVPVIENAYSFICKNECFKAMKNSIDIYEKYMNENFVKKMPIKESELIKLHKEAKERALEAYKKTAIGDFIDEFEKKLKDDIKEKILNYMQSNEKETERLCGIFINKNYTEIEKNLKTGNFKSYNDYKSNMEEFINLYENQAPQGPNKTTILHNFLMKNIFESSEIFVKKYLNELEILTNTKKENSQKLTSELNDIKNELTKESNKKSEITKKFEAEKLEFLNAEKKSNENFASFSKEKEQIIRNLNEKIESLKKENEKNLEENNKKFSNSEEILKETERRLLSAEGEFEKQRQLLEQKIKFLEKNIEEFNNKEKDYSTELKNIKKERENLTKENKEKFEAQILTLNKKISEIQEKNIDLETKLLDKEKRSQFEKNKQNETIEDLNKKIEDLNSLLNLGEDKVKANEKKNMDYLEKLKNENSLNIQEVNLAKEELEFKLKDIEEKFQNLKSKSNKEISLLKQNLEMSESSYKEYKSQSDEEKLSFQAMIRLLEVKNQSAIDSQEEYIKQINEIKGNCYNEIKNLEIENDKTRQRMKNELEEIKAKLNETENKFSSEKEDFERLNNNNEEKITKLEEEKLNLENKIRKLEENSSLEIGEMKDKYEKLEEFSHNKIEEILKRTRLEIEENNRKNEKMIIDMKIYFEAEKEINENKFMEDKEKLMKKLEDQENLHIENYKNMEKNKEKIIDDLTEEKETWENIHNNYIIQAEQDLSLCNQQIESLNKFLNEQKESFANLQNSQKQNLEFQMDSYNKEKIFLNEKIDSLNEKFNKKEKENVILGVKKEHLENDLLKLQKLIEANKLENEEEKSQMEEKLKILQEKYQNLYDELLMKKGDFSREIALKSHEIEFQAKKINDLTEKIEDTNNKYEEKLKNFKENLDQEYSEKYQNFAKDKEDLEKKLNLKKKEYKELEIEYNKDKSMLEKEKAVLHEKLFSTNKQKDDLLESIEKERELFNNQILDIKENYKSQNLMQTKENEFLKNRVGKLENDNNELINNYDKDRNLWSSKNEFLEEKLNKTRMDLSEYMKKYELSIENISKRGLMEKDKFENWQNLIATQLEERYSIQLKEYKDSLKKNYEEISQKKKELELENKNIMDKLLNEQKSKMIDQGELGKKLAASIENENRLKKYVQEIIEDRDKKLKDMILVNEKERDFNKNKIIELENKCREYETKRNNLAVGNLKDRVGADKDKDIMQSEIEKLKEKLINYERTFLTLNTDNKELLRENDKLKKHNRQFKSSNSILYNSKLRNIINTNKENRNNANNSFDRSLDGMDVINNLTSINNNNNLNNTNILNSLKKEEEFDITNFATNNNN
jgi:hypothetical protein